MRIKAYIIWNVKENRPVVHRSDFGNILVYLSKENAQAYTKDLKSFDEDRKDEVREVELILAQ